jgi:hypothetical protein
MLIAAVRLLAGSAGFCRIPCEFPGGVPRVHTGVSNRLGFRWRQGAMRGAPNRPAHCPFPENFFPKKFGGIRSRITQSGADALPPHVVGAAIPPARVSQPPGQNQPIG